MKNDITFMKRFSLKFKTYLALFLSVIVFGSCTSDDNPKNNIVPSRTVLVYMMANNNLEDLLSDNVEDMVSGLEKVDKKNAENCNFLIYYQGRSGASPVLYKMESIKGKAAKVEVKTFSKRSSVDKVRVKEVIDYVFTNYPADSEGLIFSSHADGWLPIGAPRTRWIGQDGDDFLDIFDLKWAMGRFQGNPLDFILFDCCFMQSVEVAYEFRNYTKFTIGSATETPGPGGPYKRLMTEFYSNKQGRDLAKGIANSYFLAYKNGEVEDWFKSYGVSIGVVETEKLDKLQAVTLSALQELNIPQLDNKDVFYYDQSKQHYYYDFYRLMEKNVSPASFNQWEDAFKEVMIDYNTTEYNYSAYYGTFLMTESKGLAMYTPVKGNNMATNPNVVEYYKRLDWYKDVIGKVFSY